MMLAHLNDWVCFWAHRERNYDISVLRENASTVSQEAVQQVRARRQPIVEAAKLIAVDCQAPWFGSKGPTEEDRCSRPSVHAPPPSSCLCNDHYLGVCGWFQHSEATAAALQEASKNQIVLRASLAQQKGLVHELTLQTDAIRQQLKHERVCAPAYTSSHP